MVMPDYLLQHGKRYYADEMKAMGWKSRDYPQIITMAEGQSNQKQLSQPGARSRFANK